MGDAYELDVQRILIDLTIHGHRLDAQFPGTPNYTARDFSTIGSSSVYYRIQYLVVYRFAIRILSK